MDSIHCSWLVEWFLTAQTRPGGISPGPVRFLRGFWTPQDLEGDGSEEGGRGMKTAKNLMNSWWHFGLQNAAPTIYVLAMQLTSPSHFNLLSVSHFYYIDKLSDITFLLFLLLSLYMCRYFTPAIDSRLERRRTSRRLRGRLPAAGGGGSGTAWVGGGAGRLTRGECPPLRSITQMDDHNGSGRRHFYCCTCCLLFLLLLLLFSLFLIVSLWFLFRLDPWSSLRVSVSPGAIFLSHQAKRW